MDIKKILSSIGFLGILLILCACPSSRNEDCNDEGSQAWVDNLIKISPLKSTYQQGEEITIECSIPSENNFFGGVTRDIFNETNDANGRLTLASYLNKDLYTNNQISYLTGSLAENTMGWFNMTYNVSTKNYELHLKIKLNRVGSYKIGSSINSQYIDFQGTSYCNRMRINTGIQGGDTTGNIEFIVQ